MLKGKKMLKSFFCSLFKHETSLVNNYFLLQNFPFRKHNFQLKKILNASFHQFLKKTPHFNLKECLFYFHSVVISENVLTIRHREINHDIFQSIICCNKNPVSVLNHGCCVLSEDLSNFLPNLWSCSLPAQFSIYSLLQKPSGFQLSLSHKLSFFFFFWQA